MMKLVIATLLTLGLLAASGQWVMLVWASNIDRVYAVEIAAVIGASFLYTTIAFYKWAWQERTEADGSVH